MCERDTKAACPVCPPERMHLDVGAMDMQSGPVNVSLISNLLLILLPKCSFCLLAYTSTIMLCTRNETMIATNVHASPLTIALTAAFCLFILGGILLNRRGSRTRYALVLAVTGIVGMLVSVSWGGGVTLYYVGNALVFLGIWINGSFFYLWKQFSRLTSGFVSPRWLHLFRTR